MGTAHSPHHSRHPDIDAALRTAAALTGMELVFVASIEDEVFVFEDVLGRLPGIDEGSRWPLCDTLCQRMLAGAPRTTANAAAEPAYRDVPARVMLGVSSYVGVPIRGESGELLGTLCGIDRGEIAVDDGVLGVLDELAGIVARHMHAAVGMPPETTTITRTPDGWVVGALEDQGLDSLVSAMALAELLAADLPAAPRPGRSEEALDETERLRLTVAQLEHALTARVVIEQAIGILTERLRMTPRASFERLRKAARSRGRRVHDLAQDVVASAGDPTVPLPPELHGRR
jgi:hypothetical protein